MITKSIGEKCLKSCIRLKEWPFVARLSRELHPRDGTRIHSPVQRVVTTCGFAFILRARRKKPRYHMAPEEAYDGAFAGRKLSSMTVLCSTYREHIAKNTGHSVKAGHAMRARAPFSSLGLRCSFVPSFEGPETGVNCQLLVDVRGWTRPILQRTNLRSRASVWSFASGFLSVCECSMQRYNVYK